MSEATIYKTIRVTKEYYMHLEEDIFSTEESIQEVVDESVYDNVFDNVEATWEEVPKNAG